LNFSIHSQTFLNFSMVITRPIWIRCLPVFPPEDRNRFSFENTVSCLEY
jgi:hypothetical protein